MTHITTFFSGAVMMGFLVAAAFFVRFYQTTRDRLFRTFSFAFLLLAAERVVLLFVPVDAESYSAVYLFRLAAFLCILVAIVDKNVFRRRSA